MADFGSVMAYYNKLKSLADQLANVGSPVSDQRMVLRLLAGLLETYAHFFTTIQQKDVLPSFFEVCPRLKLKDAAAKERARDSGPAALIVDNDAPSPPPPPPPGGNNNSNNRNYHNRDNNRGRNYNKNKGKGNNNTNNHGKSGRGGGGQTSHHQSPTAQPPPGGYYWPAWPPQQWALPPCPYPTRPWQQHPSTPRPNGILGAGPRPSQQAYSMHGPSYSGYTPTDVEASMHTLSMHQLDDNCSVIVLALYASLDSPGVLSLHLLAGMSLD
ncbi:uncharacterized protein LOC132611775 [Lycium barbarum]|uniref:uncharacterized protein LOC132611775 n=1 Tax=Lycium barbarum TaxID=112863 RepID=UPI00293E1C98|nr:uncharacterized protein LOC132611775 [Lycium barbarum]